MTLTIRDFFDLSGEQPSGLDDPFTAHGENSAPAHRGHESNRYAKRHEADLSPLERKLREKQRLSAAARTAQSARRREVFEKEPRLRDFARYLRKIPSNGDDLPTIIKDSWLPDAPYNVRLQALELVSRRCDQINRSMGFDPMDDPLPPEWGGYDDTWRKCWRVLTNGGRA